MVMVLGRWRAKETSTGDFCFRSSIYDARRRLYSARRRAHCR